MTPLVPPKISDEFIGQLRSIARDTSFLRNLMDQADEDIARVTGIKASLIYGHKHMSQSQAHQAYRALKTEWEEQTRREIRMKEAERNQRAMKIAIALFFCGIVGAFVAASFKLWLFNMIFIPSVFGFSGWGTWYTHRRIRRMQSRWILENLQRRIGVKE